MNKQNEISIKRQKAFKKQVILGLKSTIIEMKNSLERFKGRFEHAKERIHQLEVKTMEITKAEEQQGKRLRKI